MKRIFLFLLIFLAMASGVFAFTLTGSTYTTNGSAADVQAAINAASNGATVIVPSGSYTWAQQVNITGKYLTLRAAVVTSSTNYPTIPTVSPPVVTTPPSVKITHGGASTALLNVTSNANGNTTIAGFSFLRGSGVQGQYYINTDGTGLPIVMHDCSFDMGPFSGPNIGQWTAQGGLIYNCYVYGHDDGGSQGWGSGNDCLIVKPGNPPWYNASTMGNLDVTGNTNLYIEQCQFDNLFNSVLDLDDCSRVVVRYCMINNSQCVTHAITSMWGGRHIEFYKNAFNYYSLGKNSAGISYPNVNRFYWGRGGTGRIWGNSVDPVSSSDWGSKSSWQFIDEPLTRPGSGNGGVCETESQYPGTRWSGTGSNGVQHPNGVVVSPSVVDPWYIWNNVAGPRGDGTTNWSTNDQSGYGCSAPGPGNQTSDVFRLNRDIFLSAPNNNPSPPYTPYQYPHPLNETAGVPSQPAAPQDLRVGA
jgi:hypothetical protein